MMKTCPSCGAEVPAAANRCKECFHDFTEVPPRSSSPVALLVALAAMAIVGSLTFWYLTGMPTDQRILVDEGSRTVQWVKQFQDGTLDSERISFDDIGKLEYVVTSSGDFEIVAITLSGERKLIQQDKDKPLELQAERYARVMGKTLDKVDNSFGFGK
jgi:hypothetical protein